ncbi:unnamed protein product [Symbiodinium sp. CCMP2592]|nr:unnamed protein product [Symbiodinium sp. CCMP2592]CAE7827695.1 unnamed protein product [Symbiodinium sp. CCMP2592]
MALPLPDLFAEEDDQEQDEQEAAFTYRPAGRGGGGQLQKQSQEIIYNMYKVLSPHVSEIVSVLDLDPRMRLFGLMSNLTGVSRQSLERVCKHLDETRGIARDPVNQGGRKKRTAAQSDLPDISAYMPSATVRSPLPSLVAEESAVPESVPEVLIEDLMAEPGAAAAAFEVAEEEGDAENPEESALFLGVKRVTPGVLRQVQAAGCAAEMQPLSILDEDSQNHVVGLRLCSLALRLETRALGGREFEDSVDWIDLFFPGQLGECHHSKRFMEEILVSARQTLKYRTCEDLQVVLPALGTPSFLKVVADGFTPATGEPLDIQMAHACNDTGSVDTILLDLPPARSVPTDGKSPTRQITESRLETLRKLGVDQQQLRFRYLGLAGDGLLAGPFGTDHGLCLAEVLYESVPVEVPEEQPLFALVDAANHRLPLPKDCWTALDAMHASDKGGAHDFGVEPVRLFHSVTRRVKRLFGFGRGMCIARSVAKKFEVSWHAPMAPSSESTRLVAYESRRIPPNFFHNLRVAAGAIAVSIQARLERSRTASMRQGRHVTESCGMQDKEVKALRQLGRDMLCPGMLLFVALRYDSRMQGSIQEAGLGKAGSLGKLTGIGGQANLDPSGLLKYLYMAQNRQMSGHAKLTLAMHCLDNMRSQLAATQGLRGALQCWKNLADCVDGSALPRDTVASRASRDAFVKTMVAQTAERQLPTACRLFLEMILDRHSETSRLCRRRVFDELHDCLSCFRTWLVNERHFFWVRVVNWASTDIPAEFLTAKGLHGQDLLPEDPEEEQQVEGNDEDSMGAGADSGEAADLAAAAACNKCMEGMSSVSAATANTWAQARGSAETPDSDADEDDPENPESDDFAPGRSAFRFKWPPSEWQQQTMQRAFVTRQHFALVTLVQSKSNIGGMLGRPGNAENLDRFRRSKRFNVSLLWNSKNKKLLFRERTYTLKECWADMFYCRPQKLGRCVWSFGQTVRVQAAAARLFLDLPDRQVDFDQAEMDLKKEALNYLVDVFGSICWNRSAHDCPYQDPPEELFSSVSKSFLWEGYKNLRMFSRVLVKNQSRIDLGKIHWSFHDALLLKTFLSSAPLSKVRKWNGLWHNLMLWHALHIWGLSSSAACEGVGGCCRWLERKKTGGRAWSTGHLIRATMLRYAGRVRNL